MTKSTENKLRFKGALTMLTNAYNGHGFENEGPHYYFSLMYEGYEFRGTLNRDCRLHLEDALILGGNGWTEEELELNRVAIDLEDRINLKINAIKVA